MKLGITYTLTRAEPVTVWAGPRAIAAAEKAYDFTVASSSTGLGIEPLAYMAWTQAVRDAVYLGAWAEYWEALDDLEVVSGPDPRGAATAPSPASSSPSPSAPASPTGI